MLFYDIKLRIITSFFPIFDIKIVSSTDSLINLSFFFFSSFIEGNVCQLGNSRVEIHELDFRCEEVQRFDKTGGGVCLGSIRGAAQSGAKSWPAICFER